MLGRKIAALCLFILILSMLAPVTARASTSTGLQQQAGRADFPTVDPNYIYDQLFYMATHFQHREAGYDDNLPVTVNGHDEFAAYWAQEMVRNLQGFGPQVRRDPFHVQGWTNRPAVVPAFNVEVTVPGVSHPEQVVVIGCHYDGMAFSTQSANDDASGCAIELGVAKALGIYWRSHHVFPARTLRFVIFDAEEQGLFGSFHYLDSTINGDTRNIVAMFNEEQNGIAYPLRFLGKLSNPILPFYIDMSPLTNNSFYPAQNKLSQAQRANIIHFRTLMQQAVVAAFAQFRALGYQSLNYYSSSNQQVAQPIFTPDQISDVQQEDDSLGGSDQIPFTLAGLACATFVGNSSYYDPKPPPWSYPFDQPQDTIQLMNTFASGSSQKAEALVLALAIPGMLTTWMLHQPDILGEATADQHPIAAISDIGQTKVGQSFAVDALASFDPSSKPLSYAWNFGDGSTAQGISVNHTYAAVGSYTLTLTVSSTGGTRSISKVINVVTKTTTYANPYAAFPGDGKPPANPDVVLPVPNNAQPGATTTTPPPSTTAPTAFPVGALLFFLGAVAIVTFGISVVVAKRRRQA